ncbi:MAG: DUF4405 domain-containing protein [Desulfuromonas sp.]|nr:DUF4405 domain-containing protein [Desulfuromonas sp.]
MSKMTWGDLHINLGLLFIVVGVWHIVLNWFALMLYSRRSRSGVRSRSGWLCFGGDTGGGALPLNAASQDRAARIYGEPPYGHAELSSLTMLVCNTGFNLAEVMISLQKAKLQVVSAEQSVQQIAEANQLSPQQLYEVVKPPLAVGEFSRLPKLPPSGLGRNSLVQICTSYGLDVDSLVSRFAVQGIMVDGEMTIKQIATEQGKNPVEIYELIRSLTLADE